MANVHASFLSFIRNVRVIPDTFPFFPKQISRKVPHLSVYSGLVTRVSVQGVKSLGGHFACLFFKKKMEILLHF